MGNDPVNSYGEDWSVEDEELGTKPTYITSPSSGLDKRKILIIAGIVVAVLAILALGFLFFLFFINGGGESNESNESQPEQEALQYGIVIDLGSSGSRVNIFCWNSSVPVQSAPLGQQSWYKEVKPGISTFANNTDAIPAYLNPLMDYATANLLLVNATLNETAIFLLATAGMRLLTTTQQDAILTEVRSFIHNDTQFLFEDDWTQVLSGTQEAIFDWVTVQQILSINKIPGPTVGIVDEGGASLEVAFVPSNFKGNADNQFIFDVEFNGDDYKLYAYSYLNYGKNEALKNVEKLIINSQDISTVANDPCLLDGDSRKSVYNSSVTLFGTGNLTECRDFVGQFINHVNAPNTAINNTYQPLLVATDKLYGLDSVDDVASFFGVTQDFTTDKLEDSTAEFCSLSYAQAVEDYGVISGGIPLGDFCFQGIYTELMLEAIGVQPDLTQLTTVEYLYGDEVSWALGAMIYEINTNDL
eukprot:TRINITY_DN2727_c0_g1_i1.p1 TRINITY_DN2727_c0_g1~~TRINITY_DN2727_c0_g1_i1.p1  ORF type:complete len:505 (+),score=212.03 TRINITY_DN2727_c0_g1_i1:97-1515(+)